jgi:MFS family permease
MRFGPRRTLLPGLVLVAIGLLLFARAPVHGDYLTDVLPTMIVLGTGIPVSFPSLMTLAMSGATPSDAGLASGLVNTTVQVGGALGLAVLATLSSTETRNLRADGHSLASALTDGYHLAFLIGALLVVASIGVALAALREPGRPAEAGHATEQNETPPGRAPEPATPKPHSAWAEAA